MNGLVVMQYNPCPYPVPTVKDIIKRIESAIYRIGKYQLITDVLECGAIAIANTVDLTEREAREEQYKKVMEKYSPDEQKIVSEVFTMIYNLLSSVVYDDGIFDDYLGEIYHLSGLLSQCLEDELQMHPECTCCHCECHQTYPLWLLGLSLEDLK